MKTRIYDILFGAMIGAALMFALASYMGQESDEDRKSRWDKTVEAQKLIDESQALIKSTQSGSQK